MGDDVAVRADGLTKRFGDLTAVDGLDLEVRRGQAYGFLGPNGAGKTTTIRMLLGSLTASAGSSTLLGGSGTDPGIRQRIGVLKADLHFNGKHTSQDEIDFASKLRGGFDPEEVAALVERFGLQPERPIGQLSTGNKRKVAIVLAFAHRPDLLILDEPTGGLDPLLRHEFQELVAERQAEGATVFLSSHVLSEVQRSVTRIGIIRHGVLGESLEVEDLLRRAAAVAPMEVELADPPPADAFDRVPGVASARIDGTHVTLELDGTPVAPILARAAELGAVHLTTERPELEDLFMKLYGEAGQGDAAQRPVGSEFESEDDAT
jgi:ABC-2 type transport system ATP-binding protein